MFKIKFSHLSTFVLGSVILSGIFVNTNISSFAQLQAGTNTGLSIAPANPDPNDPNTRSRFIESMKPGDTIQRTARISNYSDKEATVNIAPEDRIANDPDFSFTSTEPLKEVGSWIKLDTQQLVLEPMKAKDITFTVTTPKDIKPGEYAGVIAVQELKKDVKGKGGFQINSVLGARVYITIPGDLKIGTEFKTFEFMTPKSAAYKTFVEGNYRQPADRVFMNWVYQNTGKVFTKVKGKLEITTPKETLTQDFDRDLNTFDAPVSIPSFATNTKWVVGKYRAKFTFENSAVHKPNRELNLTDTSSRKIVETEFEITQGDIDQIKKDFDTQKVGRPQPTSQNSSKNDADSGTIKDIASSSSSQAATNETKSADYTPIFIGGGVVIVALFAVVIFLLLKKNKKEEKTESSEKSTEEKK